jgi:hypothetical protein
MKHFLCALAFVASSAAFAQTIEKDFKKIDTPQQAEDYIDGKKRKTHRLLVFNEENHKTKLAKELISSSKGKTVVTETQFEKTYLKVIEKSNDPHYRLQYIFLDGSKMSRKNIENTTKTIVSRHESGLETFPNLAKKYSMAVNKFQGGDTSWVKLSELPAPLANEDDILNHDIDAVYSVSDVDNNLFYIVKKTHSIRRLKEVKVLRVKERK